MVNEHPFTKFRLDEEISKDEKTFTTRLTPSDQDWFLPAKKFLRQPKNSTAMKQLAQIGAIIVLLDPKMSKIIEVVTGNIRRNRKLGIPESEIEKV